MSGSILVREAICPPEQSADQEGLIDFTPLANEAAKLLGYGVLKKGLVNAQKSKEQTAPLRQALFSLGIQPFTASSVAAYKEEKNRTCKPARERVGDAIGMTSVGGLMIIVPCFAVSGLVCTISHFPGWIFTSITWLVTSAIICGAGIIIGVMIHGTEETKTGWNPVPISNYPEPIPEFALQTAVDVKKACPEANFFIEELVVKKIPDPFLVAELAGEKYYLEVWNEPGFEKVREA